MYAQNLLVEVVEVVQANILALGRSLVLSGAIRIWHGLIVSRHLAHAIRLF